MPLKTDSTQLETVREDLFEIIRDLLPGGPLDFTSDILNGINKLFSGGYLDYQACDLKCHGFRHTLQVTVAYADHVIASMVASADYLAQMSADDYPGELLFNESDHFLSLTTFRRTFQSVTQLVAETGIFWEKVVKPKLKDGFVDVYRFLTLTDGSNPYIEAIKRNLDVIACRQNPVRT